MDPDRDAAFLEVGSLQNHLRDSKYNYGCIRCKKKDVHPDTGFFCWDCFGYEYGLDAYEFIENNYVIDVIKKRGKVNK